MRRLSGVARARYAGRGYIGLLALLACSAAVTVSGCSAGAGSTAAAEGDGQVGSIALQLQVGGVTLTKVMYTILGNGFAQIDYVLDVTNSTTLQAVIGGIPAGAGYTLTLNAVDAKTGATCAGSTVFDITAGSTTVAPVQLNCRLPPADGSVVISGTVNVCPRVNALSLSSAEATLGDRVTVTSDVTDVDHGPSPLSYTYAVTSGSIMSGMGSPSASIACGSPGPLIITLTVSDGACTDSASATITCTSSCGDGYVSLPEGEACDDGNTQNGDGCSATCQLEDNASTPGDDRAGYVSCGYGGTSGLTCGPGTFCCAGNSGTFCATKGGTDCPNQMASQSCDGAEDCPAGSFCGQYHSTSCTTNNGVYYFAKCHVDADCPNGTACDASGSCPLFSGSPLGN